jgi:DNA-binding response OmpR family regulator
VRVSVTDFGPGISEEFTPRIFQPFSQSDSSDTRDKGGTGLGLAISKAIVDKHGGQIAFITREGIGTTFYVELPEMRGGEQNSVDMPRAMPATHRACVLIVENDADIAALIRRMLTEAGYDSDIAYNAGQARQLLSEQEGRYRMMTLDLQLPDEDGMSLMESLRRDAATRNLPVVVVSLQADDARRELVGGALDVRDWLQKPIDAERLSAAVQALCEEGRLPSVLHVEDEADVRELVATMLKGRCHLSSAGTLAAAREALNTKPFDLVLLDIGLPDGSGLDLIDAIERKAMPPRVVIFSANEVSEEYSSKVGAVLVKSRSGREDLLRVLLQSMAID